MLATDVRHLELGIVTALTAALAAIALPAATPPSAAVMPSPSPEPVAVRMTETAPVACNAEGITTIVFSGTVLALDPDLQATFHFRFADLPSRYSVMTGANGAFEVRIPREELGVVDLCNLPTSGLRPASFQDEQMSVQYVLAFER